MKMTAHDFANGWQGKLALTQETPNQQRPRTPTFPPSNRNGIVVFSGGSAANSLVEVFDQLREANHSTLSYVIPISDNGGSSSELIRVFGGPGIGDIRSRLVRLIPNDGAEKSAIRHFFNHRLPKTFAPARTEWLEIVEADHVLWSGISSPKRELIRSFLNAINLEMVKRLRPTSRFDFSGASIGNLFLTGARLFTGSLESAVYLLSSICGVPSTISVLPVLNTNFACHIAAGLADGTVITGQNNISHPSVPTKAVPEPPVSPSGRPIKSETEEHDKVEDANMPGTLPTLRKPAIAFSKEDEEDLPCRIERLWYINPYGQEIRIPANPRVVEALNDASCIIYSIGSLFTSIIPSLVLRDVGSAVANPLIRTKILILNGTLDRETGPSSSPYTALDFVAAIANACAESQGLPRPSEDDYVEYVTNVIYLDGPGSPKMERDKFNAVGIETMRLYGPRDENGRGGRYDGKALEQALEAIVGRKDGRSDKTRRNTLIGFQDSSSNPFRFSNIDVMQLHALLLTLLAWLAFATAAPASTSISAIAAIANTSMPFLSLDRESDVRACAAKNQALVNAIGIFCAASPVSNVQKEGTVRVESNEEWKHEDVQWAVQILWVCGESPGKGEDEGTSAGEVPNDVCGDTWWSMCAVADEYGGGITRNHGEQGCQEWTIPTLNDKGLAGKELYWGPFSPGGGVGDSD